MNKIGVSGNKLSLCYRSEINTVTLVVRDTVWDEEDAWNICGELSTFLRSPYFEKITLEVVLPSIESEIHDEIIQKTSYIIDLFLKYYTLLESKGKLGALKYMVYDSVEDRKRDLFFSAVKTMIKHNSKLSKIVSYEIISK